MLSHLHTKMEARIGCVASGVSLDAISQEDCQQFPLSFDGKRIAPFLRPTPEKYYINQCAQIVTNHCWLKSGILGQTHTVLLLSSRQKLWIFLPRREQNGELGLFTIQFEWEFNFHYIESRIQFEKWELKCLWDPPIICRRLFHVKWLFSSTQSPPVWHFARARPCLDSDQLQ